MKKPVALFCCFNNEFLNPFLVLASSLKEYGNLENIEFDFHIFCSPEVDQNSINIDIPYTLHRIDNRKYIVKQGKPANRIESFLLTSPMRLDAIDILKTEYSHGVYLDCDILIKGDITEMFKPIKGTISGATDLCNWIGKEETEYRHKLNINYFNAGVMLLNFDKLESYDSFADMFLTYDGPEKVYEQDFINSIIPDDEIDVMSSTYNCLMGHKLESPDQILQINDIYKDAIVQHFIFQKPWYKIIRCYSLLNMPYFEYAEQAKKSNADDWFKDACIENSKLQQDFVESYRDGNSYCVNYAKYLINN